ncbi:MULTISPECIES: response regulator [Vibrio]|uniref:Response regulator n=1 Tax=Vibrio casei TaxID=673372 RepID=A0A368LGI3_9VIBR|nr:MULTISPECIES: response regulator [Vibrio]RCS69225.1 response regulator [Vibrio casei]SJN37966.1 Copper-sensing two-component system response regulator CpxR [Vibrio casei]HBV76246.1 DNA-binding response regulator [Vibrio sp.]
MTHILLVDDDSELTGLLEDILTLEGFTVSQANNGIEGLDKVDNNIDLILLDYMMPKMNGMEMLKQLRQHWQTPVLMLTAKGEEIDRVIGLELGADDYLPKPFSDRELLARIRAILRRTQLHSDESDDTTPPHGLQVFPGKQEAYHDGQRLDLTTTEFLLLDYFLSHMGESISKETLSLEVLGKRLSPFDRAIDMHVSNLRKKLSENHEDKAFIKTLRGRGYLMVEDQ